MNERDQAIDERVRLQPSAQEVLSRELRRQRSWRSRLLSCREEMPSWLVSLVLHLVFFLMITAVAAPPLTGPRGGAGRISLEAAFSSAEETREATGPVVSVRPVEAPDSETLEQAETTGLPKHVANTPVQAPRPTAEVQPNGSPSGGSASLETTGRTPTMIYKKPSKYAGYLNRLNTNRPAGAQTMQVLKPITEVPLDPEQRRLDQVVDDFIAFDVGQLSGAAGRTAQRRFSLLGPEAIPALVRGLNKSASIHASCPVGMIAGKLMTTLRLSSDPSLRDYALANVGMGVPESAPHYHRLQALRKNWLGANDMPQPVSALVERIGMSGEGELLELTLALTDAPAETLAAALRSHDDYLASAAILAIIQGERIRDPQQQSTLRRALAYFCQNTTKRSLRSLADDADRRLR
ncbi:MAG: hypothetical protein KDA92_05690 [Planctomycetales bacterium]|nr:hypothetical protein [Planctomycetales bacterium]MCA9167156.1 hypothetical protein [Planctomycetales bacterium]